MMITVLAAREPRFSHVVRSEVSVQYPFVRLHPDLPLVEVRIRAAWRQWLTREHPTSTGAWVVTVKKAALGPDDEQPPARRNFDAFPPSARRGILEWINAAKTPTTRDKRVAETAHLAQQNIRANQWPRR